MMSPAWTICPKATRSLSRSTIRRSCCTGRASSSPRLARPAHMPAARWRTASATDSESFSPGTRRNSVCAPADIFRRRPSTICRAMRPASRTGACWSLCPPFRPKFHPYADSRVFLIVGAGAAGAVAAQTLREEGFGGRIIMLDDANPVPDDRTLLSKYHLSGQPAAEKTPLQTQAFYRERHIERRTAKVERLDVGRREVHCADGQVIAYDAALVATGGIPKSPSIPGAHLRNVFLLRSIAERMPFWLRRRKRARGGDRFRLHRHGGRRQPARTRPGGHRGGPGSRSVSEATGGRSRPGICHVAPATRGDVSPRRERPGAGG